MVEDYQGKEGNTDLYRWVRKNARISQATKDDIVAINQSSCLSKRQWMSVLDQRSKTGDVNAISLHLRASTAPGPVAILVPQQPRVGTIE
jgi:hypothetical protein